MTGTAGEVLTQAVSRPCFNAETSEHNDGLSAFAKVRSRLFGIAYRMLGSAAEAEDAMQDVWLRWQSTDRSVVQDPAAFLATTTTRLCINLVQSARSRRETCVGEWLPEPVDTTADPALDAERGEALELALLVLLDKLSPTERAAYVLREAFDYSYRQIADILQSSQANTRQLVARSRKHIAGGRSAPISFAEQQRLLSAFSDAAREGDLSALESLFTEEAHSEGGGMVHTARAAICGRERAAKLIGGVASGEIGNRRNQRQARRDVTRSAFSDRLLRRCRLALCLLRFNAS